jgi:hypothetical protein
VLFFARDMIPSRCARWVRRPVPALLCTLALAGVLLSAANVPHVHVGPEDGFYNHEHDLSYLAALGGVAPLPEAAALVVAVVVVPELALDAARPASEPRRHSDSRAPPLR